MQSVATMGLIRLCVAIVLGIQAVLVVSASASHDDEAVSKQHVLSKRHLQPVLNQLNRFLGTEILTTTAAPESLTVASVVVVPPAGVVVPAVVLPVTKEPTTELPTEESTTAVSAAAVALLPVDGALASESSGSSTSNEAAPLSGDPKAVETSLGGELHRSRRSLEALRTIDHLVQLPHKKLEQLLRSLPGGKFVVEDHYNASAPKPLQELNELLHSLPNIEKHIDFNKKVEIELPTKTVTKTSTIAKRFLPKIMDRIKRLIGSVAAPAVPTIAVPVPCSIQSAEKAPALTTAPTTSEVLSTAAPLLAASVSKVVKISVENPAAPTTTLAPEVVAPTTLPPGEVIPAVVETAVVVPAVTPPVAVVPVVEPPVAVVPAVVPPVAGVPAVAPPTAVVPAIISPVAAVPSVVVPPTAAPVIVELTTAPPTTAAPTLEASVSKVVKIPVNDANPDAGAAPQDAVKLFRRSVDE